MARQLDFAGLPPHYLGRLDFASENRYISSMGLFDIFGGGKKEKRERPNTRKSELQPAGAWKPKAQKASPAAEDTLPVYNLQRISYGMAYYLLPQIAHRTPEKIVEFWTKSPDLGGIL